eukprot:CAMPEP_0179423814 /NCGR_PEP_ID=MMETSP0799-20121207/11227_1 /TAXON_ID=46947 /ORGANISM="Geminigera cryophila, Strain CCMP2564" /LENGTH=38 /DNA_ID= /DNA_START= /DNA_END= /DNA_ORIENTATION=
MIGVTDNDNLFASPWGLQDLFDNIVVPREGVNRKTQTH